MTLNQLRYVIQIADSSSMNEAAKALYISQPSLSASVRELEEEIGMDIFARSNRGITLTPAGKEFLGYARQVVEQYELIENRYINKGEYKKRFSVSMQHYTFAVNAFIEVVRQFSPDEYDFSVHETRTGTVIKNVKEYRSEVGILYLNDFNRKVLTKIFAENDLSFHELFDCHIYAYISKKHPLAKQESIGFEDLKNYPCLYFEQGDNSEYLAEEILSENIYPQTIRVTDRSTMLNLVKAMNGYTLCSGIVWGDYNGDGYIVVPYRGDEENPNSIMEIGYITKKNSVMSKIGVKYLEEIDKALAQIDKSVIYED